MPSKKERKEALERMTKAELVRTVTALDARQTKLLNEIAKLRDQVAANGVAAAAMHADLALARSVTEGMAERREVETAAGHDVRDHAARLAAINEMVPAGPLPWEQK